MMGFVRAAIGLTLLLTFVSDPAPCAGQVAVKAARVKAAMPKAKREAGETVPADALKPSNAGATADPEEALRQRAAEQANLDLVAGPLQVLFGGGRVAVAAQAIAVDVQLADPELQNDAMTQQFMTQLFPHLKSELAFVRLICSDLTPEQRSNIRKPAEAALKEAARQLAKQQNQMQRGIAIRHNPTEASKLIREAIQKALKETVTEQQFVRYTDESNQRMNARKRAAILALVSRLDGYLYLTNEQREKITESISSKWQDQWEKWLKTMYMYGDHYFPMVPDQCVGPFLRNEQKAVWQTLQKVEYGNLMGGAIVQNLDDDGWWGDNPANLEAGANDGAIIINRVIGF